MQKYFEGDPSDAVNMFFHKHFKYLGDEHAHDRDQFRKSRLYNDAVEAVFKKYLRQLKYFFAQKADRVKFISWDSWRNFLESTHLIDSEFSRRQAGLVFQWSKMRLRIISAANRITMRTMLCVRQLLSALQKWIKCEVMNFKSGP